MSRYQQMFQRLEQQQQGAFVPFVTLGDPSIALSRQIIEALIAGGADALELGIPFSDPVADGPTIQGANIRALQAGVTPGQALQLISEIRASYPDLPIGLLLYSNLVMAKGIDGFYQQAAAAGVDSVLIADVPLHESKRFRQAAMQHGVAPIFIVPPNCDDDTLRQVASYGRGYTYLLSRAGVTGTETQAASPAHHLIDKLAEYHAAPTLLGFGISEPEHVKAALRSGAAGAISGSAIVKRIETLHHQPEQLLQELTRFVQQMKAATQR
ncbi:MAG: tryptophan synthase subunit alpha [Alkalimonas sp.]|nr:tryptophan synthase subunit alpha [Alkalimonas sp.]